MSVPKRKEELTELTELNQSIEELRSFGISPEKLQSLSQKIFQILNNLRVRAESIVETVREPLIILDKELRIVSANPAFYKLFKVNPEDVEGHILYEINDKQWNISSLRVLLERIIPHNTYFNDYEVIHDFSRIGQRLLLLNARVIHQHNHHRPDLILLAMEDVTERRKADEEKTRLINELQNAMEKVKTLSGLLPVCANCKKIRNDKGQWVRIEKYIEEHSEASFSHSICPDCERKLYGENGEDQ